MAKRYQMNFSEEDLSPDGCRELLAWLEEREGAWSLGESIKRVDARGMARRLQQLCQAVVRFAEEAPDA